MSVTGGIQGRMATAANDISGCVGSPAASLREGQEWFSAGELAALALPGMPADKRQVARRAQEERWSTRQGADGAMLVRMRQARGGGLEFHASLLPAAAQLELARRGVCRPAASLIEGTESREAAEWRWFEAQSTTVKAVAHGRAAMVAELEALERAGLTRTAAIGEVSATRAIGKSTLWAWLRTVEGVDAAHRLPALAPRRRGGGATAEIDPLLWSAFKSDFLRLSQPTLTSCYERVAAMAAERGLPCPGERSFRRRFEREVPAAVVKLKRHGDEALRRSIPAQRRSVEHLQAMEHVNIDGHRFDVFAKTADGRVVRPMMVAIQDIYSRKLLAWRIGESESAVLTRLAFADLFQSFGIPKACTLDNGRAFASKWITGGARSRYRFKIREEEPTGLLTGLGIAIHWALPYRGQSKPIERAFRDLCDTIAKHPEFEGAYTGNSPTAKPENYGSRAVAWDVFVARVESGIAAHNARAGRRGGACRGRSFDQVFAESYATSPVGKATPEQLRMALLAAEQVLVNRQTGEVSLYGNRYWSPECGALAGQRVTVRFDPDDLGGEIHLYSADGRFACSAEAIDDTGFDSVEGAKATAKRLKDYRQRVRAAAEAEQLLASEELVALQADRRAPAMPEAQVIRPIRHRGSAALAQAHIAAARPGAMPIDRMQAAVLKLVKSDD